MADLTVANYLAALQDDPWDENAFTGLSEVLATGDVARVGKDPVRLLEFARRNHEVRGESFAAAKLMECEIALVSGDPDFAAVLYRELGRIRRDELMDDAGARAAYAKALELRPGDEEVQRLIEQIDQIAERFQEIADHFIEQANQATDATLKTSLLVRAASILWQHKKKGKNKDVDRLFKDALHTDPASARAARLYELTLRERAKWKEVGEVLLAATEHVVGRDDRLGLLLAGARVLSKRLDDNARAVSCYERVLELLPAHDEALGFLVAHFTEHKQWDHLVAVYEDALRARQLKADAEHGIVLQIAMVQWKMLGRPDRAEPYFARVRKADPAQPVMLDFYREQYTTTGETLKLVAILSDAQRRTATDQEKLSLSLEIARVAQNDPQAAERAIDAFKLVLRHVPIHAESLASLKRLYRRSGKWNALVELLRGELEGLPEHDSAQRLELLNELLVIYRDELKLEASVLSTYNAILQLDPANLEAAEQLSRTYEALGRWNDLIPVLMREAEAEPDSARKVELYLRVGRLWIEHFSNYNQATAPLEQVLALEPDNREALGRLREIYGKKRSWKQLAQVLAKEAELCEDEVQKKQLLSELALLYGERLHEYAEAIAIWKRLLALEPGSARALEALEKLAERAKDWDTLAETLEHRIELADDAPNKIRLLTRLGTLHGERTLDPARAANAWKRVLALDPKNGRALRTLREAYLAASDFDSVEALYAEANDWEGFVDVLGAAADRTSDVERKKSLSFRAAEVYEKKLNEPARAFRAYERVLAVQSDNERAVRALLPIYEKDEKWPKVAQLLDILLSKSAPDDKAAQLSLLGRLTDVQLGKLRDGERAFGLALRAYQLAPGDREVRGRLEASAEQAGFHERLASTYAARADQAKGEEAIWLRRRVAQIAAERLKRPDEAAAQLEKILEDRPDDREAQDILERIYRATGRHKQLRNLYVRKLEQATENQPRFQLLATLAALEERELGERGSAIERFKEMHALRKEDRQVLAELDRLVSHEKRSEELLEILNARIALADDNKQRVELVLRVGALSLDQLGNVKQAIQAFSEALGIEPTEPRAVAALERIASEHAQYALRIGHVLEPVYERTVALDKLSALLKARLAEASDAAEKRALRLRLSELSATLGDPKAAYATLESAFLDSPQNPELWDKLTHVAERAGSYEELAVAFSTVVELGALAPADSAELSKRTARIYDDVLGQAEKAEPFHERVLAFDPLAEDAYQALRELYTNRERWEELKRLYRNRIAAATDGGQKLELLLQVCFLFEEILDDVEMAIRSYCEVLELEPQHSTSRRALERLYTRAGRFRDLVDLLEGDRADAEGKEAIELSYRVGELYEHKLSEPARAVDQYAEVLAEQPTHLRAQEALGRLLAEPSQRQRVAGLLEPVYTEQGAHVELAKVLEVQLEELKEAGVRVAVLLRLSTLYERELRDVGAAFRSLLRAVESDPSDETARLEFARVAALAGKLSERAALLEAVLPRTDDPHVKTTILGELAELWDILVGDQARAIDAYTRLIASDADNAETVLPAARALERLHTMAEDYPALAGDLRKQIDFESGLKVKKDLLAQLAELCEQKLSSVARAIAAWAERLELDAADLNAMLALERLYESEAAWLKLIGILQRRDSVAKDEGEARLLARRIGEIYERELKDADNAITAYNDVLARFGSDRETVTALARVYEASARWQDLLETVQTELSLVTAPLERAEVRFRAAELMRKRTGATEAALDAYRAVLEDQPGHERTLAALNEVMAAGGATRLEAARILAPHYATVRDHDRLIHTLEVVAESDDTREQLDALRRAAEVAERGLSETGRAYALTAKAAKAALLEDDLAQVLDELDRLAHASGRFEAYGQLLHELAPDVLDEEVAITHLMRAAGNARDRLGDASLAREYYEKVLALRPEHDAALSALEALHAEAGDHRGLLAVLRKKTELAGEPIERTKLLLRQAELCAGPLDDVDAAIDAYEKVLEDTQTKEVFAGLELLYQRAARYAELASMYERQMDLEIGDLVIVRYRLAELWRKHLDGAERALDLYEAVLERAPTHEDTTRSLEAMLDAGVHSARAAELLEPVYLRRSRWPELTRALEAQLAGEDSPARKKELLGRLGQLHEVQLEDLDSALETYGRLFRVDPADLHAWDALTRLARVLGRQLRVAEVYEQYLDESGVDDELGVKLAVNAAQIRDQHGHDLLKAGTLYQRALAFNPNTLSVANALEDVLVRRRDSEELRTFYRAQADVASDEARRVLCLHRLGKVLENELRETDAAIKVYQEILQVADTDKAAITELDRLLSEAQHYNDLAEHLSYQIGLAVGTPREAELKLRLAEVYEERLDDVKLAIDTYEDTLRVAPDNDDARGALERLATRPELLRRVADILAPLYESGGEWEKQIWLSDKLVGIESDVTERSRLYGQIARLYEERGQALGSSLTAWRRALATDPSDDEARAELSRIAAVLGDWDALVQALEEAVEVTVDDTIKVSLLAEIAQTHDQKRGDPRAAISAYERLIQVDIDDPTPLAQLEALLTMVGDWEGLVALYKRKVERSFDAVERAELWRRSGSVLDDLIGDTERAIRAYVAALEEVPEDELSLAALDELYQGAEDYQALADVLRRRADLMTDARERLDVNLRLGATLSDKLSRAREAIDAYERALEDDPSSLLALVPLSSLYEVESMWPELLDGLRRQLELDSEQSSKKTLLYRIGQVLDERLSELDDAIDSYREVLLLDATHEPSIKALFRIGEQLEYRARVEEILEPTLRQSGRWDDVANLLARGVTSLADPFDRQRRFVALAQIHEQQRGDAAAAFTAYCEAHLQDAEDAGIAPEIERLAGQLSSWERAAEVIDRRAASTSDPQISRDLYRRLARIAEHELKDVTQTIEATEQALERAGDEEELLAELTRLYAETRRFDDLADVLERRVSLVDDHTASELLLKLGALREDEFTDARGALSAYRDVLERVPGEPRAVAALERLLSNPDLAPDVIDVLDAVYRKAGDLTRVADLYEARLKLTDSPGERVSLLSELASLWEREAHNLEKAGQALRLAFETEPTDYGLLDEVERIANASGSFDVLRGLVEVATRVPNIGSTDSRDLWMRAAGWYGSQLNDLTKAQEAYRRALDADPDYEPAHEGLCALLRTAGKHQELVNALVTWAERESDRGVAVERLLEAARVAEQSAADLDRAVACYERALTLDDNCVEALDRLIQAHESQGRVGKVVQLYERRIALEDNPVQRISMRHRAAAIRRAQLDDQQGAMRLYRENLEDEPADVASLDALEELYEQAERWNDLVATIERRVESAPGPSERATARVRLAMVSEKRLKNRARAIDELREIVLEVPQHVEANAALERLLEAEGRWADLVEQLERKVDLLLETAQNGAAYAAEVQLARTIEERLGDVGRAEEVYERVLERDPANVAGLRALARLCNQAGDSERAVSTLESLLALLSGEERVTVAYELAELAEQKLASRVRAEAALRAALSAGVRQAETREKLFALCERQQDFKGLAQLLAEEVELTDDPRQKVQLLRRASELSRGKLGDTTAAAGFLERAAVFAPDDRSVLVPLCELYIGEGRQKDAVPVLQQIIASFGGRRVKEVAGFHHMLARAFSGMGDPSRALTELDAAYRVDLTNIGVLKDLGLLAYQQGDFERAQKTFRGLLLQRLDKDAPISKADVYFYLGDISRQQGDAQKAISMLERAVAEQAGHERAKSLLSSLKS